MLPDSCHGPGPFQDYAQRKRMDIGALIDETLESC